MHKQRIAIVAIAAAGAAATFMPWLSAPLIGYVNGSAGDGWITFALFLISLVLGAVGAREAPLARGHLVAAVVPGALAGLFGIWKMVAITSTKTDVGDNPFAQAMVEAVSVQFGLYLVVLAGLALPVAAVMLRAKVVEA